MPSGMPSWPASPTSPAPPPAVPPPRLGARCSGTKVTVAVYRGGNSSTAIAVRIAASTGRPTTKRQRLSRALRKSSEPPRSPPGARLSSGSAENSTAIGSVVGWAISAVPTYRSPCRGPSVARSVGTASVRDDDDDHRGQCADDLSEARQYGADVAARRHVPYGDDDHGARLGRGLARAEEQAAPVDRAHVAVGLQHERPGLIPSV